MAELYLIANGAAPTTASQVAVTTGTAIKTMLQVKMGTTTTRGKVVEWGISFDGNLTTNVGDTPIICELLTTGTVAATVTAHVAAGIQNLDPLAITPTSGNPFTFSTSTTGYTASAEGTITTTRMLDVQQIAPYAQYVKQWPLGREPFFSPLNYLRVRVKATTNAVNAICYVIIEV